VENVCVGVQQLLAVGELFKQLVLSGAYQLTVVDVPLCSGCRLFGGVNLTVIELVKNVGHLLILQNNMLNV